MCWYVDDFDIIFPMDNISDKHSHRLFDDEFSKDESSGNIDKSRENFKINEEESTGSSVSKSIDEDNISVERNTLPIKKEKQDETGTLNKSNYEKNKLQQQIRQRDIEVEFQQTPFRNRTNPIRKWQRQEEVTLILFLKENTDFEKPNARMYYTKFLFESTIDADWKHVRNKVRNMRVSYRKAKEHEIKEADSNSVNLQSLRNQMLKICWFMDDFDILFPNDMDNSACLEIYRNPDPILDDEFSRDYSPNNVDDSSKNFNSIFLPDDESSASSLPNCIDEDILTVHKNVLDLEKEHQKEKYSLRQQELELAKEKLNFEKAKFREEIRLKEREIENEEKLKMMEFQMEERIALKKLEIEEMLALKSMKRPDNSYIYHNLT